MFLHSTASTTACRRRVISPRNPPKHPAPGTAVITCVLNYTIDPGEIEAFERFALEWMRLVNKQGGVHHGYYLPAEGDSDRALALFSFDSLASYETYRKRFGQDPEFIAADRIRDESGCVVRHERTFMRPLWPRGPEAEAKGSADDPA